MQLYAIVSDLGVNARAFHEPGFDSGRIFEIYRIQVRIRISEMSGRVERIYIYQNSNPIQIQSLKS